MNTIDALLTRRTIRRYTDRPLAADTVHELVKLALQAPSAADARPWHLISVDDRGILKSLAGTMPGCDMLLEAPAAIVICGDPSLEKFEGFWPQDCSCAAMVVLLAAHERGLGACWIGLHPVADRARAVSEALKIPEGVIPLSMIALGYPAEELGVEDRYDEGKLHHNRW